MAKKKLDRKGIGGRPSKFTPENTKAIIEALELGVPATYAPQVAGVDYNTFRGWIVRGEKEGEGEYWEFSEAIKKSKAIFIQSNLQIIKAAAKKKTWNAAAWLLERSLPAEYARRFIPLDAPVEKPIPEEEAEDLIRRGMELMRRRGQLDFGEKGKGKTHGEEGGTNGATASA